MKRTRNCRRTIKSMKSLESITLQNEAELELEAPVEPGAPSTIYNQYT